MVKHFRTENYPEKSYNYLRFPLFFSQNQGTTILNHMDFPEKLSIIRRFCGGKSWEFT